MKPFSTLCQISFFALLSTFLLPEDGLAQQNPFMSSYLYQPALYNPAALEEGHIALAYRRQWLDLESAVAPSEAICNVDFSQLLSLPGKIGLGLNLMTQSNHIFNQNSVGINFAYHLFQQGEQRFSLGVAAGLKNQRLEFGSIRISNPDDVALYSGQDNAMVFNGGPGLFYKNKIDKNELAISVVLPQLFTSDFSYNEFKHIYDNRFHVQAGIQYKIQLNKLGVEPSLLFRGVNGEENLFSKSTLDVNVRLLLMDDQFWVSGGTRLNGNAFLGGLGMTIKEQIDILAFYEYHNQLNSSFEIGFAYRFKEREDDPDPVPMPTSPVLDQEKASIEKVKDNITASKIFEARENVKVAQNALNQLSDSNLPQARLQLKTNEVDRKKKLAKSKIDNLLTDLQPAYIASWKAGRIIKNENPNDKSLNKIYDAIQEDHQLLENKVRKAHEEYLNLNGRVLDFKLQNNLVEPIGTIIKRKDIAALDARLKSELSQIPGSDFSTSVEARQDEELKITYRFPYVQNTYMLGEGIDVRTLLVDHIITQINQLKVNQVKVSAIHLRMLLQEEIADMQQTNSTYPYQDEFGQMVSMVLNFVNTDTGASTPSIVKIQKEENTSITDLAVLQMRGAHQYLLKRGIPSSTPVYFEITGPNYEQENFQTFEVEILIKQ